MSLVDEYTAALFDLDGVVYLGPAPVEGAPEGIRELKERGTKVAFVTNNAARKPQVVVDQLVALGVPADLSDVVTSAQAASRMLADHLPAGSIVLVTGTEALADEVRAVGLAPVSDLAQQPVAVIQGYDPNMTWQRLDLTCQAIQAGAQWFATNTDSTRPTEKGLVPGAGAQIAAVQTAVTVSPLVAGKPCPPLLLETLRRLGTERAIFVGDRLDTDIEGAVAVGMDSLFVFTGAHGKADLLAAGPGCRPTHIGYDLRSLLEDPHAVEVTGTQARCGAQKAELLGGEVTLLGAPPVGREAQLDALRAVLALVWGNDGASFSTPELLDEVR